MAYKDKKDQKKYMKEYREKNKEALQEYHKEYREKNKEAIQKYQKEYHKEYYEKIKEESPWIFMTKTAKCRTNLPSNIDSTYIKNIWPSDNKCPALGIEFKKGRGKPIDSSPSLDRILPELGYIKGNVQIISMLANQIMSNATPDQVIQVGEYFKKITEEKNAA
jgi:hypothetical protein